MGRGNEVGMHAQGAGVESGTLGTTAVVQVGNPDSGHGASSEEQSNKFSVQFGGCWLQPPEE